MNFEMKELPRQQSDRVRDQRIERVVELVSPAEMLEDLPLGSEREDAVLAPSRRGRSRSSTATTTGCWSSSGPAASTIPRRRSTTPSG